VRRQGAFGCVAPNPRGNRALTLLFTHDLVVLTKLGPQSQTIQPSSRALASASMPRPNKRRVITVYVRRLRTSWASSMIL
jgi:hypothetical protein